MKKINERNRKWIPGSHENPKNPGVFKKVIVRHDEVNPKSNLMMINLCMIPASATHVAHKHQTMDEIFYFTEGSGEIKVGKEINVINPGDRIIVPANTLHQVRNTGTTELKFIGIGIALD